MKQLFFAVLVLVFCLATTVSAEEDYKRLYLEQKVQSLRLEMQTLQLRFTQIQSELPQAMAELQAYNQPKPVEEDENATVETELEAASPDKEKVEDQLEE